MFFEALYWKEILVASFIAHAHTFLNKFSNVRLEN